MKKEILIFVISFVAIAQSASIPELSRVKRQFAFPGFGSPQGMQGGFPGLGQPFGGGGFAPGGFAFPGQFNQGQSPFGQQGFNQGQPQGQGGQFGQGPPGQFGQGPQGQFNQGPGQGQFNQRPNQGQGQFNQGPNQGPGQFNQQQPNQGQFGQQQPNQFNQQMTTPATTISPQVQACSEQCVSSIPATYNPVCGSDGTTYQNRELFDCNVECGRRITLAQVGGCPGRNATTNRPNTGK